MNVKIFREYRLKFYLNARHYIIIGDQKSDTHPHTWEFALTILIRRKEFVEFKTYEDGITGYLDQYQDKILNDLEPFDSILPTLENMTDYFAKVFYKIINDVGAELLCVESSEGPSRSYILDFRQQENTIDVETKESDEVLWDVIDGIVEDLID